MKKTYATVTDLFCGAGGSSLGAVAGGAEVSMAVNHWQLAVDSHATNFPATDHDCRDIQATDPRRYPRTDLLIASPECTNHSLAKGKRRPQYAADLFGKQLIDPSEERSRATMWDVPRFAERHAYELIIVENVVDARSWVMWDAWLLAMDALGYDCRCVYLNSMFCHPTPQSRDRMYVVFWRKVNKAPDLDIRPIAPCLACGRHVEAVQTWKRQDRFPLVVGGVKIADYVADFTYLEWYEDERGESRLRFVVEDWKPGVRTAAYKLKARLMLGCHGIEIRETGR